MGFDNRPQIVYRIPFPDVLAFLRKLGPGENQNLEAYGEVQEKVEFKRFSVDPRRFGLFLTSACTLSRLDEAAMEA
jgi:hypothetical protein